MSNSSRKGAAAGPPFRVPAPLAEAIGQLSAKVGWRAVDEQFGLPKSTFHTSWKQEGRGKAAQVLKVCVGLHRMGLIRTLNELEFIPGEIDDLKLLFDATMAPMLAVTGEDVPTQLFTKGGASRPPVQTPPPGGPVLAAPAPSPSAVQAAPAPVHLSRHQPVIHANLTLFDQWRVHADYFEPLKRDLKKEFDWPEASAAKAVIVLRELVVNAFKHGCRGLGDLPVSFSAEISQHGEFLTLIVNSPGPGFDFQGMSTLECDEDLPDEAETALSGLSLVRQYARELVGTADGRKIMAVMAGFRISHIRGDDLFSWLDADGNLIAVVTLPTSVCFHCFNFGYHELERLERFLDSAPAKLWGGILDAKQTTDFDSASLSRVFIGISNRFGERKTRQPQMRFCMVLSETLNECFNQLRFYPFSSTFLDIEQAIDYVLG